MSNKGEQYGPGWAYVALMVHEDGEIHAVGGDRRGDDPEADLPYIGLERLEALMGQQQSGFSCAKRAADPQNEFAACNQWCGDSQRCMTGFDTAKFFRHVDAILGMDEWQRENSTFGAREATPELMAAIRAVTEIEGKTRRSMFGALSEHKQITNAPEVSSEHIQELARMCGLIPAHTTAEWVSTLVRFVRVVLDNNSVQEAFVRANVGLLAASHEHEIISRFLERTGQYVTNDASRCAAMAEARADGFAAGKASASPECTCPSGDGSLRHPCPAHPAANIPVGWYDGNKLYGTETAAALDGAGPILPVYYADPAQTDAARDVLAERHRQVEQEGWSLEHDDWYGCGELASAAAAYALSGAGWDKDSVIDYWPWELTAFKAEFGRRSLIKAAALLLAEIERLDRAAMSASKEGGNA